MLMLLVIACLIPVIYLGYLVSKFDQFVEGGGFVSVADQRSEILVFGETELAKETAGILRYNKLPVVLLTQPGKLEEGRSFHYIIAISENDVDNLFMCRIGAELYSVDHLLSLCNNPKTESLFRSNKIPYLSGKGITAEMIVESVMQKMDVG